MTQGITKTLRSWGSDGIKVPMRKWIFLALTLFVLSDAWADAREAGCTDHACSQACHSVCQTHLAADKAPVVVVVMPPVHGIAVDDVQVPRQPFVKFLFRPPKTSV